MGTKGRDISLYGYFGSFVMLLISKFLKAGKGFEIFFLLVMLFSLVGIGYFYFFYLPLAKKKSKKAGFKGLVFLPLYPWWANFLLWLAGKDIRAKDKAFEVHLEIDEANNLSEFLKLMDCDLKLMLEGYQDTLMIWETHVPLPHVIRQAIMTEEVKGNAFWEKGSWPIPKPPLTYLRLNRKRARFGAGIVPNISERRASL